MMISTQPSANPARQRRASGIVWLLAGSLLAACSLLAPSDAHYLGDPSRTRGDGGDGGDTNHARGDGGLAGASSAASGSSGEGGSSGSDAGASNGGDRGEGTPVCPPDFADCNRVPEDGCEVDLRSSKANCGGCGDAFACGADEVCEKRACISVSGCSDGTREGFLPVSTWPRIAGCTAYWQVGSLRAAKTGVACGYESDECAVPADACGPGWHVCASPEYGPTEISSQATQEECAAQPGAFAAAVGDQHCEPCGELGTNDGAACCGARCVQQWGNCIYPGLTAWFGVIDGYKNVCGAIESYYDQQGVLCCRTP